MSTWEILWLVVFFLTFTLVIGNFGYSIGESKSRRSFTLTRDRTRDILSKDDGVVLDYSVIGKSAKIFVKGENRFNVMCTHRSVGDVALQIENSDTYVKLSNGEARQLAIALELVAKEKE